MAQSIELNYNGFMDEMIRLIEKSKHAVAFTGAGVSTFSGLKDFRGKNGLGKIMEPEKIFDIDIFNRDPSFFYRHARELVFNLDSIQPSIVHLELARLEKSGYIKALITQNIDMLHQKGGSGKVIELHGSAETLHCRSCGKQYVYADVADRASRGDVPYCEKCRGVIKPDITFYGEPLPGKAFQQVYEETAKADLIIALGSTLIVQPAASFIDRVLDHDGKLIVVNNQKTPYDRYAEFHFADLEEFCLLIKNLV